MLVAVAMVCAIVWFVTHGSDRSVAPAEWVAEHGVQAQGPVAGEKAQGAEPDREDAKPPIAVGDPVGAATGGEPVDKTETASAAPVPRVDIGAVDLAVLIQALNEEASTLRRECYEEALAENLALVAKLPDAERAEAERKAHELADSEFSMRTLRNLILKQRYVYNQPPPVKVEATPDTVWMGQTGTLRVGSAVADYFVSTDEYPELGKAIGQWQRARGAFRKLAKR
ncbi:MAG: hypothetical protein MUC36_04335 [Planctomycetes bacterium]|nr:hypothetical protein [Planctomycetota bacterium]